MDNPIILEFKDKNDEFYDGKRYKILRRVDGKVIIFDKLAPLGKATSVICNGSVKAIKEFNRLEKEYVRSCVSIRDRNPSLFSNE